MTAMHTSGLEAVALPINGINTGTNHDSYSIYKEQCSTTLNKLIAVIYENESIDPDLATIDVLIDLALVDQGLKGGGDHSCRVLT
jgi:hypothetical protein